MPLSGITVTRLEDSDLYKNAFELSGPMIEKRIAVCQSKEEADHWVDLLKKHMPNNNQKMSPCHHHHYHQASSQQSHVSSNNKIFITYFL